ncbi:Uncharacterised protein [uncultured Clostridium sp.]|nr:Uncharacterised protein [uncultured Clostridium sp.]
MLTRAYRNTGLVGGRAAHAKGLFHTGIFYVMKGAEAGGEEKNTFAFPSYSIKNCFIRRSL